MPHKDFEAWKAEKLKGRKTVAGKVTPAPEEPPPTREELVQALQDGSLISAAKLQAKAHASGDEKALAQSIQMNLVALRINGADGLKDTDATGAVIEIVRRDPEASASVPVEVEATGSVSSGIGQPSVSARH